MKRKLIMISVAVCCVIAIALVTLGRPKDIVRFSNRTDTIGLRIDDYVAENIEDYDTFRIRVASIAMTVGGRVTVKSDNRSGIVTEIYPETGWQKQSEYKELLRQMGNLDIAFFNYTTDPECLSFSLAGRENEEIVYNPEFSPERADDYVRHISGNWFRIIYPYE